VKRIWDSAAVIGLPDGGYGILLDDKPLKKPGGQPLALPFGKLAEIIAGEWRDAGWHGRDIIPDDLPFTRLATTAIERVSVHRDGIIGQLAAYALHDLLCYRAPSPAALVLRQAELWDPWLAWAGQKFRVTLAATAGVNPVGQPPDTAQRFAAALGQKTDFELAGLGVAIPALGSAVLGLAFLDGAVTAGAVFELSVLDELFQAERWGEDAEAAARHKTILADLVVCETFWAACRA
jgi:chaperone required for assembly of F1-ATPase